MIHPKNKDIDWIFFHFKIRHGERRGTCVWIIEQVYFKLGDKIYVLQDNFVLYVANWIVTRIIYHELVTLLKWKKKLNDWCTTKNNSF